MFLIVFGSTMLKMIMAYICAKFVGFNNEEAHFVSGLWTGKASCQAALCGVALEMVYARNLKGTSEEYYATTVFMSMICAILIGVPFATSWISVYGGRPLGLIPK
jgi:Kef-type K+ transport system membrane component KefB